MNTDNNLPVQQSMGQSWDSDTLANDTAKEERKPRKKREKAVRDYSKRPRKPDYVSINYCRKFAGVSYPVLKQLIEDNDSLLGKVHVNKSVRYSRVDIEQVLKIRIND